jgi:outer membrane immunogenic protein
MMGVAEMKRTECQDFGSIFVREYGMLRTNAIAVFLVAVAGAAYAGGPEPLPPEPVVVAPVSTAPQSFWEGGYIGAQLGYAHGKFSLGPNDFNDSSLIGGLNAGYLWRTGNGWYLGPEIQYDFTDLTVTDPTSGDSASFKEVARLKLIVGKESGNGLLYASGGLAYGRIDGASTFFDGNDSGYVVGLGYDWRMGESNTLGVEYQHHNFNSFGNSGGDVALDTIELKVTKRF